MAKKGSPRTGKKFPATELGSTAGQPYSGKKSPGSVKGQDNTGKNYPSTELDR